MSFVCCAELPIPADNGCRGHKVCQNSTNRHTDQHAAAECCTIVLSAPGVGAIMTDFITSPDRIITTKMQLRSLPTMEPKLNERCSVH